MPARPQFEVVAGHAREAIVKPLRVAGLLGAAAFAVAGVHQLAAVCFLVYVAGHVLAPIRQVHVPSLFDMMRDQNVFDGRALGTADEWSRDEKHLLPPP